MTTIAAGIVETFQARRTKRTECDRHGPFEPTWVQREIAAFGFWTQCPECDREIAKEQEDYRNNNQANPISAWHRKLEESGVPPRFRDKTLDSFVAYHANQQKALKWAKGYVRNFREMAHQGRSFLLIGRPGTGKTHLACCIAMALLRVGCTAKYTTAQAMMRRVRATFNKDARETEPEVLADLKSQELLVIDELGVQNGSDFERNLTFDVLNARYEDSKPTLLMSNLPKQEVEAFVGERIMDRIREDQGKVLHFDWNSYRDGANRR